MERTNAQRVSTAGESLAGPGDARCAPDDGSVAGAASLPSPPSPAKLAPDPPATSGLILWTLAKGDSTAEACRWVTPTGFEFELQIWTGRRIKGEEDLSLVRVFPTEAALAEMALTKKRQLESAGWLEEIRTSAR